MGIHKYKFAIIVLSGLVLAGGGLIGYKFYQEEKREAVIEAHQKAEKEALQEAIEIAETRVNSAEVNPIQVNIEAAEVAVNSLPESKEKQKLLDRVVIVKEEYERNLKVKEEARLAELENGINQAKITLGIDQSPS
jgi:hypothetical protein